jgi:putative protein-disulfide isomerase
MKKIAETFKDKLEIEVLSGGMIIGNMVQPIENMAKYIDGAYKNVEALTGVTFGEDYLWHIKNPHLSDWAMDSEKPSIALCIFKEYYPYKQVEFAADLQFALHAEGRDLCDNEAYRHLLEKYGINEEAFFSKLTDETYIEQAHYEFSLCKQLQVTGFPAVLLQENDQKFHLLAKGFTDNETLQQRISDLLIDINK